MTHAVTHLFIRLHITRVRYDFQWRIVNGLKDAIAVVGELFESAQQEIVVIVSLSVFSIAGTAFDSTPSAKSFIQNGGVMRGMTTLSRENAEETRIRFDIGEDRRHSNLHYEIRMIIGDRQQSLSAINIGIDEHTLDTPVITFRTDDPTYTKYPLTSFENVWSQSISAEERPQWLLK